MLNSIYHMTLKLLKNHAWRENAKFWHLLCNVKNGRKFTKSVNH